MSEDDKKWEARCDAHILADAEEIKADEARYKAATEAAKELAEEKLAEAAAASKVAAGIVSYPSMKKEEK
jgi:hypothetical protein